MEANIYILIPTADRFESCRATLESLSRCEKFEQVSKVLIINNGSPFSKSEVESLSISNLDCLQIECKNKSLALNAAVQEIQERNSWMIFFDDDASFSPHILEAYLEHFARHTPLERIYFGGACASNVQKQRIERDLQPHLPLSIAGFNSESYGTRMPAWFFLGTNWAVPRRTFDDIGFFNAAFGPGSPSNATGNESDFQRRLFEAGYTPVFLPNALVVHRVPEETITLRWLAERKFRNGVEHAQHRLLNASPARAIIETLKIIALFARAQRLRLWNKTDLPSRTCELAFHRGTIRGAFFSWFIFSKREQPRPAMSQ